ncbi:hypothetical protein Nepgr_002066 [Nepenthes gracilis]|uniref:Uncharacterized protein n=1 Tax=Nepenthes gracilis TaxID=150966 RepID=A0AAD3RWI8_NEPGR|nr:hypothetical protein Nepgr_002066 [Nepenthes gracilis]
MAGGEFKVTSANCKSLPDNAGGLLVDIIASLSNGIGHTTAAVMEQLTADEPYDSVPGAFVTYGGCVIDLVEGESDATLVGAIYSPAHDDRQLRAVTTNKGEHTLLTPDDFFQPDAILENKKIEAPVLSRGTNEQQWIGILSMFHQSLNNSKKLNVVEANIAPIVESDGGACEAKEQALIKINEDFAESVLKQECAVCSPCSNPSDESSDLDHESGAIVPVSNETLSHHTPPLTNSRCLPKNWKVFMRIICQLASVQIPGTSIGNIKFLTRKFDGKKRQQ